MNKQYFENEEEAYKVFDDLLGEFDFDDNIFTRDLVDAAKQNGYIKRSELEKAKILNDKIMGKAMGDYDIGDINTMINYNIELKKEIERLKK